MKICIESRVRTPEDQAAFERLLELGFQSIDNSEYELNTELSFNEVFRIARPLDISCLKDGIISSTQRRGKMTPEKQANLKELRQRLSNLTPEELTEMYEALKVASSVCKTLRYNHPEDEILKTKEHVIEQALKKAEGK